MQCLEKAKISHHDIKPQNILVDSYGRAKLVDFGLSLNMKSQKKDKMAGTWSFLAPEVIKNNDYSPYSADIWSLGVTVYYCLTGELPFQASSVKILKELILSGTYTLPSGLSPEMKWFIVSSLNNDPGKRPSLENIFQIFENHSDHSLFNATHKNQMITTGYSMLRHISHTQENRKRFVFKKRSLSTSLCHGVNSGNLIPS